MANQSTISGEAEIQREETGRGREREREKSTNRDTDFRGQERTSLNKVTHIFIFHGVLQIP